MRQTITKTLKIFIKLFKFFPRLFAKIFWFTCEYTGKGAEIVKSIPAILIAIIIFYPAWSFPIYLWLSLTYGSPLNYLLYSLWVGQIIVLTIVVAYFDRIRKSTEEK